MSTNIQGLRIEGLIANVTSIYGVSTLTSSTINSNDVRIGTATNSLNNKLVVSGSTDPVRFQGLVSGLTDNLLLTSDSNGVIHTTPSDAFNYVIWSTITTSQTAQNFKGYITNGGSRVNITLPTTAAVGSIIEVFNLNANGWSISQNTNQYIIFGSVQTTTTSGSLSSTQIGDSVKLICVFANNGWAVVSSIGNITYV
jgi:hypothetical protein